MTDLSDAMK